MFGLSSKWNPDGKHVYITGGSAGLGLSLAEILTQKGAHVSIVARNKENLVKALAKLEQLRVSPSQKLSALSHSLDTASGSTQALQDACRPFGGQCPDAVFACAGRSRPKFFVEMDEQDLVDGMTDGYWVQAWTAWAAAKQMARENKKRWKDSVGILNIGVHVFYWLGFIFASETRLAGSCGYTSVGVDVVRR